MSKYTNTQILEALTKSVTHWQEIVAVFGGARVEEELKEPEADCTNCALCCLLGYLPHKGRGTAACADCPLGNCTVAGSQWDKVSSADTNPEAYTAAQAMLARLEELAAEYSEKVKAEECDIRVGDIVVFDSDYENGREVQGFSGEVTSVTDGKIHYNNARGGKGRGEISLYKLIHRPKGGK